MTHRFLIPCLGLVVTLGGCNLFRGTPTVRETIETGPAQIDVEARDAQLAEADLLTNEGQYDSALVILHGILEDDPTSTPAYLGIGDVYLQQKDYRRAEPAFSRAAKLEPRNFDAQFGHAVALQMLGRLVEAVRAYHRALTIEPESSEANRNLATTYLQMDVRITPSARQKAVQVDPNDGVAWVNLGRLRERRTLGRCRRCLRGRVRTGAADARTDVEPDEHARPASLPGSRTSPTPSSSSVPTAMPWNARAGPLPTRGVRGWRRLRSGGDRPAQWRGLNGLAVTALNRWLVSNERMAAWDDAQSAFRASLRINLDQAAVLRLMLTRCPAELRPRLRPDPIPFRDADTSLLETFPTPANTPF